MVFDWKQPTDVPKGTSRSSQQRTIALHTQSPAMQILTMVWCIMMKTVRLCIVVVFVYWHNDVFEEAVWGESKAGIWDQVEHEPDGSEEKKGSQVSRDASEWSRIQEMSIAPSKS